MDAAAVKVETSPEVQDQKPVQHLQVIVKAADMEESLQAFVISSAQEAMARHEAEKDIASYLKKACDAKYDPSWHVVVGKNFGSYVTHVSGHFVYFYLGNLAMLVFKAG